tara:strand:+ start:686 stop:889 length:204 start_codon:yes stop_codon:yes gene_type:complete
MKATIGENWKAELNGDLISLYHNDELVKAHTVRMNDAVDHFKVYVENMKQQLAKSKASKANNIKKLY